MGRGAGKLDRRPINRHTQRDNLGQNCRLTAGESALVQLSDYACRAHTHLARMSISKSLKAPLRLAPWNARGIVVHDQNGFGRAGSGTGGPGSPTMAMVTMAEHSIIVEIFFTLINDRYPFNS